MYLRRMAELGLIMGALCGCAAADMVAGEQNNHAARPQQTMLGGSITAALTVTPAAVQRTYPFTARLTLTNTSTVAATWTSGSGCLAFLNVYNGQAALHDPVARAVRWRA
jgi:hypothetical protein